MSSTHRLYPTEWVGLFLPATALSISIHAGWVTESLKQARGVMLGPRISDKQTAHG